MKNSGPISAPVFDIMPTTNRSVIEDKADRQYFRYHVRQVASPWVPRRPEEVGKRGVGAERVILSAERINSFIQGSRFTARHAVRDAWWGTWEVVRTPASFADAAEGKRGTWYFV